MEALANGRGYHGMTAFSSSARRGGLIMLACLSVVLTACSSATTPGQAAGGGSTGAGQAGPAVTSGDALEFSGTTLDGESLDVSTLAGTPVVLWFWAPWCTICRAEAPDVAEVAAEFDGQVTVLGVPGRGEVDAMRAFVSETGTGAFTHVVDSDGSLWTRFGVVSQPSFVFVDGSGAETSFAGSLDADDLRAALSDLV